MGVPPALELDAARDEVLGLQHRLDEGELALVARAHYHIIHHLIIIYHSITSLHIFSA